MSKRVFGSMQQLPSGRWQARYTAPSGEMVSAETTFRTKAEASRFLADMESSIASQSWHDPARARVTLREYAVVWLKHRTVRGRPLAQRTIDTYQNSLDRWILPVLGDEALGELSAPRIRKWHSELGTKTGPTATRQAYALLRALMNTAVDDEVISRNPCRVKGAGQPVMKERPLLALGQVDAIRRHMPEHLQNLVTIALWAHTRIGETIALQRGDFDPARGTLRIERQQIELAGGGVQIVEPKAGSRRTTHLPRPAIEAAKAQLEWLEPGLPTAPLFTDPRRRPLRAGHVQHAWAEATKQAGLPGVHFHDLRHAGLTLSAQSGATLAEVMRRAGHVSSRAALIYQHAADQRDAVIADLLTAIADVHGRPE